MCVVTTSPPPRGPRLVPEAFVSVCGNPRSDRHNATTLLLPIQGGGGHSVEAQRLAQGACAGGGEYYVSVSQRADHFFQVV